MSLLKIVTPNEGKTHLECIQWGRLDAERSLTAGLCHIMFCPKLLSSLVEEAITAHHHDLRSPQQLSIKTLFSQSHLFCACNPPFQS